MQQLVPLHHVGGEQREPRVGLADVQHGGPEPQQLVDRHLGLRRGLAQQPPRVRGRVDDSQCSHVTNLTPGSECKPSRVYGQDTSS
jgi:hypothetical protein